MVKISAKNIAQAIYESSKDKDGESLDFVIKNAVLLINKSGLLGKSKEVEAELEKIIDRNEKVTKVKVSSRSKLGSEINKKIEEFIKKKYGSKEVRILNKEDSKLLGGIKIEVGDEILDATLSSKVKKLQTYLTEN